MGSDSAHADRRLGASDSAEPELARVGRLAIAHRLDDHTSALHQRAHRILTRAYDGEDVTREDLRQLQSELEQLEYYLQRYVEPVVADREAEDDDEAEAEAEAEDDHDHDREGDGA